MIGRIFRAINTYLDWMVADLEQSFADHPAVRHPNRKEA
jgi:hypothetical protein